MDRAMPAAGELVEDVRAGLREIEELRRATADELRALGSAQWSWRPEKDRWSIGECVAHVNQTNRVYLPAIEEAIGRGRERGMLSNGPYRHGFFGELMLREMEPPPRRRFRVPRPFMPVAGEAGPAAFDEFTRLLDRASAAWSSANGVDLGKVMVTSPANRFLRLSLGQALRLVAAHTRRHLWQAKRVANEPRFPRS